jgi:hypothetical protein
MADDIKRRDHLFHLIAGLESHFAADDMSPADVDRWRALKYHIVRMKDALDLVEISLREERERGIPITAETSRKIEGYARFGLGITP